MTNNKKINWILKSDNNKIIRHSKITNKKKFNALLVASNINVLLEYY